MIDQGIYTSDQVSMHDYVADRLGEQPSMSKGVVRDLIEDCPFVARIKHPRFGGASGSNSSRADIGTLAHQLLLGGDQSIVCVPYRDYRTKAAQKARDDAWNAGKIPVLEPALDDVRNMASRADGFLRSICSKPAATEVTLLAEIDGAWQRSRVDWLSEDYSVVIDYKTTKNANPREFAKRIVCQSYYDVQATMQLQSLEVLAGRTDRDYYWLVQSTEWPYMCSVVEMSRLMREFAASKIDYARQVWKLCLAKNEWPDYGARPYVADPPSWTMADFESIQQERDV